MSRRSAYRPGRGELKLFSSIPGAPIAAQPQCKTGEGQRDRQGEVRAQPQRGSEQSRRMGTARPRWTWERSPNRHFRFAYVLDVSLHFGVDEFAKHVTSTDMRMAHVSSSDARELLLANMVN
jgi:hypothetical protein